MNFETMSEEKTIPPSWQECLSRHGGVATATKATTITPSRFELNQRTATFTFQATTD